MEKKRQRRDKLKGEMKEKQLRESHVNDGNGWRRLAKKMDLICK